VLLTPHPVRHLCRHLRLTGKHHQPKFNPSNILPVSYLPISSTRRSSSAPQHGRSSSSSLLPPSLSLPLQLQLPCSGPQTPTQSHELRHPSIRPQSLHHPIHPIFLPRLCRRRSSATARQGTSTLLLRHPAVESRNHTCCNQEWIHVTAENQRICCAGELSVCQRSEEEERRGA